MASLNSVVCVLVMVAIATGAVALQCYNCISCNDPFDASSVTTVECSGSCLKAKSGGEVLRSCSLTNLGDTCEKQGDGEVCSCTSNLCNSAPTHEISVLCLISITIAALF